MMQMRLTESQRKTFLKSFSERDMQKELKILFEKMYQTSVYILQGTDEFGKDLIIKIDDPTGARYISVVVKMGDISGSVKDMQLMIVKNQIEQSLKSTFFIDDKIGSQNVNEVYVVLFGSFSNNAQTNIDIFLKDQSFSRQVRLFDINNMDNFFVEFYPDIFCGASGLEALIKKDEELSNILLQKDRYLTTSFIEPNIKRFKKNGQKKLLNSKLSNNEIVIKTLQESLFGVQESIQTFSQKLLEKNEFILVEGEAGSGKSVFSIKLAQEFIRIAISELPTDKANKTHLPIKVPILVKALDLKNTVIKDFVNTYYQDSTYYFKPVVIIVDGLDEVPKDERHDILNKCIDYSSAIGASLIFTCRKNYNLIDHLDGFLHYEIVALEISQAISYVKKVVTHNKSLLDTILKGLQQIEHQIPLYPMALSLLVEIVKEHNEVPASISELYVKYINLALGEKDAAKGIEVLFEYKIKKNFLSELSYYQFFIKNKIVIEYNDFSEFIKKYVQSHPHISSANNFIDELRRGSLLIFDDEKVEFLHKSFLDYFIAEYFSSNRDELEADGEFEEIYKLYYIDFWSDVTLFFFGIKTKITRQILQKIITIGEEKKGESDFPLASISSFMLGRLMQYAWDSKSDAKELAIERASDIILDIRSEILDFLVDKTGLENLPTISSDFATLHLFDLSYSSMFLIREIENFVKHNLNILKEKSEITDERDKAKLYFSSMFVLTNYKLTSREFIDSFFNDFLLIEDKVKEKEIIIPLVKLFNFMIERKLIIVSNNTANRLEEDFKQLNKKFSNLVIKTLLAKNKDEIPFYRIKY